MKLIIRRILNLALWLNVCLLGGTGALLYWRMPHGPAGRGLSVFGFSKHDIVEIHTIGGFVFAGLVIAHLWLAWPWLKNAAAKKKLWPVIGGLAAGLVLALGITFAPIQKTANSQSPEHAGFSGRGPGGEGRGQGGGGGNGAGPMLREDQSE
ncbi:DUF4405 domain-containing protein [Cerasicoccus maritimus]|uniref:DUF4405 domain-containing protein n=1 Tax=Cerasicoccus maritimus TaxID=490089 RepID=UPI002852A766|nr:DUF4405 domain-containing protein [Cerasicoccus maritimus]